MSKYLRQIELEHLYNKNQLMYRMRNEFINSKDVDFCQHIEDHGINLKFGIDLLVQMALHKRTTLPILAGIMRKHMPTAQDTVKELYKCAEADLVDWEDSLGQFVAKFLISEDVQEELDRFQYPLPMIVEPKELKNNKGTGYLLGQGSVILKDNHHEDDVCLDHINRLNMIQLCINHDTATMIKNQWRGLDKARPGETAVEFERRKKQFEKYDRTAKDVIDLLTQEGNEFYLTHKYDKRGRTYCQGHHVTYQGTPWNKAVIQFARTELVKG